MILAKQRERLAFGTTSRHPGRPLRRRGNRMDGESSMPADHQNRKTKTRAEGRPEEEFAFAVVWRVLGVPGAAAGRAVNGRRS
jgi:hypothetical protein